MKHSAIIDANESVLICTVGKGTGHDMFEATIIAAGDFQSGTITIQASPDKGVTKVNLRDISGSVVAITDDDAYNVRLGYAGKNGQEIELYATMASAAGTPAVEVSVFDNR